MQGRTLTPVRLVDWLEGFNSRPRVGGERASEAQRTARAWLQLTPPRGGERSESPQSRSSFNSRPTGGGRTVGCVDAYILGLASTRAPVWANSAPQSVKHKYQQLQLTPHVGANPETAPPVQEDYELQLTPHRGGELNIWALGADDKMLQFTPPCGANIRQEF